MFYFFSSSFLFFLYFFLYNSSAIISLILHLKCSISLLSKSSILYRRNSFGGGMWESNPPGTSKRPTLVLKTRRHTSYPSTPIRFIFLKLLYNNKYSSHFQVLNFIVVFHFYDCYYNKNK